MITDFTGGQYVETGTAVQPLTVGNISWPETTGTIVYPHQQYQWITTTVFCTDDTHVFGCEHATTCKCGKASRKLEAKKCPSCGKKA